MEKDKKLHLTGILMLSFASAALVLVSLSYERGILVMMHYVCPMAFAFAGIALLSERYRKQIDLWAGIAFAGWYVLSRLLMKELYLDYSFSMFSNLCCVYLLAFPFARSLNDGQTRHGLKAAAAIFTAGYGLIAWLGVLVVLLNRSITLPGLGTTIELAALDMRLIAGNHPNISACMFLIALMLGIWLLTQLRKGWLILPVLLLCIGAYAGIALTDSRTVIIQTGCFAAVILFIIILRLNIRSMWKKAAAGLLLGAVCIVLVYGSFQWVTNVIAHLAAQMRAHAEAAQTQVVANRGVISDLTTVTIRVQIYQDTLRLLKDRPGILFTGMLNSEIVQAVQEYTGAVHTHNAFLQTLVNMGLPGLLMALFFTVRAVRVSIRLIFSRKASFSDQLLAAVLLAFLIGTIPEPYLFTEYLTLANMPFFLVFGYALEAEQKLGA